MRFPWNGPRGLRFVKGFEPWLWNCSSDNADEGLGCLRPGYGVFRRCAEGSLGCSPDNRLGRLCRNSGI